MVCGWSIRSKQRGSIFNDIPAYQKIYGGDYRAEHLAVSQSAVDRANAAALPSSVQCIRCNARFLTASALEQHVTDKHPRQPPPCREVIIVPVPEDRRASPKPIPKAVGISARLLASCQMQGDACYWCGAPFCFDRGSAHPLSPTREHGTPKSLGGTRILAIVHRQCNMLRGTIDADTFRRLMKGEAVTREEMWPHHFVRARQSTRKAGS